MPARALGEIGDGVHAVRVGDVERARTVKMLRDDCDGGLAEDGLGAHHRIERAAAGEVERDVLFRHAGSDEVGLHRLGLVVVLARIVAAHQDGAHLAGVEEPRRRPDPEKIEEIGPAPGDPFGGAEEEGDRARRHLADTEIGTARGAAADVAVDRRERTAGDDAGKGDQTERLPGEKGAKAHVSVLSP